MISSSLASALAERREQQEVVDTIGDILLAFVYQFTPYIAYGSHQIIGKHYFELEKRRNQKFANFVRVNWKQAKYKLCLIRHLIY